MIQLTKHPRIIKQNLDGSWVYDLPEEVKLKYPGRPLVPVFFWGRSALEVMDLMIQRKAVFDAEQKISVKKPGDWVNVGYLEEPSIDRITVYYQIGWEGDLTSS